MAQITAALVKELREKTSAGIMDAKKALVETNGNMEKAIDVLKERGVAKAAKKADRVAAEGMTDVIEAGNTAAIIELNSETDFVASNEKFLDLLHLTAKVILEHKPADLKAALAIPVEEGTLNDQIVQTSAHTGEKITLRRFNVVEKNDNQTFGVYSHMGGQISVITVLENSDSTTAKDIAMHIAAIAPKYLSREDVPKDVVEHEKSIQMKADDLGNKPDNIKEKIVEGRLGKFLDELALLNQPFVKGEGESVAEYLKKQGATIKSFIRYQVGEGIEKQESNLADEVAKQING
ncbi:translation elongation factor Ts [Oenococcus oeni]|uniref:Elongation factor Ts n=1 Tax=Oenococcus oeni TaxID=1247 RepID=A0A483BNS1_OENOE|nr:translation elongation factor Ts [Oenococcus oeni]MDV7686153.1 elongation factor Ts [Oenococcus oeni]OIK56964.1 translation elongation factor Ts [Oenococcus oeni]OIM21300.1 translation elongation factor Ts [Oenococcus oeni]OIM23413.1 translation elongation factor Ts [Oenococcus oeni]OIM63562.1 translation elongation factor Ts [Oenococcus oeni]